jgi:hypothetical protein
MANSIICSGSGTGVGVPPDDDVLLLPLDVLPPELLDPPHFLLNQQPHVALAGVAATIIVAAPTASNILFTFIIIPLFLSV